MQFPIDRAFCPTFLHEAAHAMAFSALEVPLRSVRVDVSTLGVPSGAASFLSDVTLEHESAVLVYMAGASSLTGIAGFGFDEKLHTFCSDLRLLMRNYHLPCRFVSNELERGMVQLAQYRLASQYFVGEWVIRYKRPIVRLAFALASTKIVGRCYELQGRQLNEAISNAWRSRKPNVSATAEFACRGWRSLPHEITINLPWQLQVLNS